MTGIFRTFVFVRFASVKRTIFEFFEILDFSQHFWPKNGCVISFVISIFGRFDPPFSVSLGVKNVCHFDGNGRGMGVVVGRIDGVWWEGAGWGVI